MAKRLQSCLCCCLCQRWPVRKASIVIAVFGIIINVLVLIGELTATGLFVPQLQAILYHYEEVSRQNFEDAGSPEESRSDFEAYWHRLQIFRDLIPWAIVVEVTSVLLSLISHGSLLYGLTQNRAVFMVPYLLLHMISLVCSTILLFVGVICLCVAATGGILAGIIALLIGGIILALGFYLWSVVNAAYIEIKHDGKDGIEDGACDFNFSEKLPVNEKPLHFPA